VIKFHIIYKTTCLVTGKWYLGKHSTKDLNDGYLGSGTAIKRSIKKHGRQNHVREVLEHLPSLEALNLREASLITKDVVNDPMSLNLKLGGQGGFDHITLETRLVSRKTIKQRRAADEAYRIKHSASMSSNAKNTDVSKAHAALRNKYKDPAFKAAQIESLRLANTGRKAIQKDGIVKMVPATELQSYLDAGWVIGRPKMGQFST
jgi:hypothetical protein